MSTVEITLADFRKTLKGLGYKVSTKRHSEFIAMTVTHLESGEKVAPGNVFSAEFLARHKPYFDYKNGVKVREDDTSYAMRVV